MLLILVGGLWGVTALFAEDAIPPGLETQGKASRELLTARLAPTGAVPEYLGTDRCLYCHDTRLARTLQNHPTILEFTDDSPVKGHSCETCHGPGSIHPIGSGNIDAIIHPLKLDARSASALCLQCHADTNWGSSHDWMTGPHAEADLACVTCHDPHSGNPQLLRALDSGQGIGVSERTEVLSGPLSLGPPYVGPDSAILDPIYSDTSREFPGTDRFCLSCHESVAMDFDLRSNHPLDHGGMSCASCHDPHKREVKGADLIRKTNGLCESCHVSHAGPFVFPHAPVNDVGMGDGCLTCHQPHGSSHDQLLTLDSRGTCLQCHVDMDSTGPEPHFAGSCWASGCHSQVHGSHTNIYFLEEEPEAGLAVLH